jgi:hypothetical protein
VIEDPDVVDLVVARRDGSVELSMFEERPWDGSDERMQELEDKVSSYVTFVVDGHLRRQHPELDPGNVHIRLHYRNRMDARTRAMLPEIELALAEYGIDFSIAHLREIQAG